jgi:hypothetical protein
MPDFRLVSKSFIGLSELEEKILLVAQKRSNEVKKMLMKMVLNLKLLTLKQDF